MSRHQWSYYFALSYILLVIESAVRYHAFASKTKRTSDKKVRRYHAGKIIKMQLLLVKRDHLFFPFIVADPEYNTDVANKETLATSVKSGTLEH